MNNEIISRLDGIETRLAAIERHLAGHTPPNPTVPNNISVPAPRPLSITEYVLSKKPADDNQRTLVLAAYLETYGSQSDFTADELRQAFINSRLKPPVNVNDKIAKRAQKAQIMQAGERDGKKTWRLTMTGLALVEKGFGQ